jgi:SAM-dependent methyltransferase
MPVTEEEVSKQIVGAFSEFGTFRILTATGTIHGEKNRWTKATIRPLLLRGEPSYQFTFYDQSKSYSQNYRESEVEEHLTQLISLPFNRFHVRTENEDLHIHITKKGRVLTTKGKPQECDSIQPALKHDRTKQYLIPRDAPDEFLHKIGIMDAVGNVIPRKQDKYKQINEFLRLLDQTIEQSGISKENLHIIDCGCGNAYLTFAAYHYLNHLRSIPTHIVGVDRNGELIERCNDLGRSLGWANISFIESDIAQHNPPNPPDIVVSLHACDTATDEAIARGVKWQSRLILAAPCCHKELRSQIKAPLFSPVLRHGALKQRTADILTDACRAQVLRILGYKTDVVQFVDSKHTPKNLLIRAIAKNHPGPPPLVREYEELRDYWHVNPAIERYLSEELAPYLTRNEDCEL